MKKLTRRYVVLAISFLIFILLFIYYKETRKADNLETPQSTEDIEDISNVEVDVSNYNIGEVLTAILEQSLNEVKISHNNIGKVLIVILKQGLSEVKEEIATQESMLKDLETKKGLYLSKSETADYYGIVKSIGDVEQKYIDAVEEKLLTLPRFLVNSFIEEGWSVYVTTEDIATQYGYNRGTVMGITDYQSEAIYIEDREKAVQSCVEHEFGHYLDYIADLPSLGNDFNPIYQEEVEIFKSNISNPYCVTGRQEFFAETFACIIVDESKCTPKAKEFIESVLNELISCN